MGTLRSRRARLSRLFAHTPFRFPHPRGIHLPAMEEGNHGTIGAPLLLASARLERLVRIFGSPVWRRRQLLRGELLDQHIGARDRPDDILGPPWGDGEPAPQPPGPERQRRHPRAKAHTGRWPAPPLRVTERLSDCATSRST